MLNEFEMPGVSGIQEIVQDGTNLVFCGKKNNAGSWSEVIGMHVFMINGMG